MEMLKLLTHKLKEQSLDEVQGTNQQQEKDDRDSGTESDEENGMKREELTDEQQQEQIDPQGSRRPSFQASTPTLSNSHPTISRRPFQLVNHPDSPFNAVAGSESSGKTTGRKILAVNSSTQESSDFERCSLDYEPGSSVEFEHHSSEEELSVITANSGICAEKRKWSQVHRCSSCTDSSGSSDEEVCHLLSCSPRPVAFSSSPPKGVHKLTRTLSPHLFFSGVTGSGAVRMCTMSPRKRHRQNFVHTENDNTTVIHRPCLDFEKMQVWKFQLSTCMH